MAADQRTSLFLLVTIIAGFAGCATNPFPSMESYVAKHASTPLQPIPEVSTATKRSADPFTQYAPSPRVRAISQQRDNCSFG